MPITKRQLIEFMDSNLSKQTKLRLCEMYINREKFYFLFSVDGDVWEFKKLGHKVVKANWERMGGYWTYYVGNEDSVYSYYEGIERK